MKSTLINKEEKAKEIKYPCLMVTNWDDGSKMVVLFSEKNAGTVVFSTYKKWNLGDHSGSFNMYFFEPFDGTIQLTND